MANRDYDQDRGGMGRGYDDRDRMGREGGRGWMDRAREYFDRAREMGRDYYEREHAGGRDYPRGGYDRGEYDRGEYDRGYGSPGGGTGQGGGYRGQDRDYDRDYDRGGMGGGSGRGYGSMGGNSYPGGGHGDLGERNPSQGYTGGYGGGYGTNYASSGGGFGSGSQQSYAGRGSKNYRRSDARIEEDVHEMLMRHHEIDATDIDVRVESGEVTLSGEVEDRRAKRLAEELAERCQGVRDVHNNLRARRGLVDKIGDALGVGDADRGRTRGSGDRDVATGASRDASGYGAAGATGTASGMGGTGGPRSTGGTGGIPGIGAPDPTTGGGIARGRGTTDPGVP